MDNTDASYVGTNETITTRMLGITPNSMANMAGQTVSYCLQVGSTLNDTVGAYAYTTFSSANVTLPEQVIVFTLILIFLPKLVQLAISIQERRRWRHYLKDKAYAKMMQSLGEPYILIWQALKSTNKKYG
jgi:hypothetical protein